MYSDFPLELLSRETTCRLGTVAGADRPGTVTVRFADFDQTRECRQLRQSGSPPLNLCNGDEVLVWLPEGEFEYGVVMGIVEPASTDHPRLNLPPSATESVRDEHPDEVVIEANKSLTLRCGDGSITLRKDGKILIKGEKLVSHAKQLNRIKGGSVTIN